MKILGPLSTNKQMKKKDNRVRFISKFINILFISLSQRVFFLHFIAFLTVCVLNLVTNKSILKTLKYSETFYIYLFILSRIKSTIIFFFFSFIYLLCHQIKTKLNLTKRWKRKKKNDRVEEMKKSLSIPIGNLT